MKVLVKMEGVESCDICGAPGSCGGCGESTSVKIVEDDEYGVVICRDCLLQALGMSHGECGGDP